MSTRSIDSFLTLHSLPANRHRISFIDINELENLEEHVEDVVEFIKNNKSLEDVVVDEPLAIEDETKRRKIYKAILCNSNIDDLDMSNPESLGFPDEMLVLNEELARWAAQVLREMTNLSFLTVNARFDTMASAAIFSRALQANRTLGHLCFEFLSAKTSFVLLQSLVRSLRFRSSLNILTLLRCHLSDEALSDLVRALEQQYSSLRSFRISIESGGNPIKTVKSVEVSSDVTGREQETETAVGHLVHENRTLQEFTFDMEIRNQTIEVDSLAQSLAAVHPSLKKISLRRWGIDDRGMHLLCDAAIQNKEIESLDLNDNNFGAPGIDAIRNLLSHQTALRYLGLSGNDIDNTMVASLCEPIAGDHPLESLDLGNNNFGDEKCINIAQALKKTRVC